MTSKYGYINHDPTDLDLINILRLRPGDTIQKHFGSSTNWIKYRRTLLWHGEQIAVWSCTSSSSSSHSPNDWKEPIESARPCAWTGMSGDWQKIEVKE
jgi:hypothetical protein